MVEIQRWLVGTFCLEPGPRSRDSKVRPRAFSIRRVQTCVTKRLPTRIVFFNHTRSKDVEACHTSTTERVVGRTKVVVDVESVRYGLYFGGAPLMIMQNFFVGRYTFLRTLVVRRDADGMNDDGCFLHDPRIPGTARRTFHLPLSQTKKINKFDRNSTRL